MFALRGDALAETLGGSGRARDVWSALRAGIDPFVDARVPAGARRRLNAVCAPSPLRLKHESRAADGTIKLLFALADDRAIEAVLIPTRKQSTPRASASETGSADLLRAHPEDRTTLCISTQVGCARGCTFCLTATMKLVRNLDAAEIAAQVAIAIQLAKTNQLPPLRNLVLMGMGEPLDNLDALGPALAIITDSQHGLGFGPARITLSTVGPSPRAILAAADLPARMAWSLHAADEETRRAIVPTMRHTVVELRDAFLEVVTAREEPLFVEMTLIDGVNDRDRDAHRALELFAHYAGEVRFNLLPMNAIGASELRPSPPDRVAAFEQILRNGGRFTMVRRARGASEGAACGQLAVLGTRSNLRREASSATTTQKTAL